MTYEVGHWINGAISHGSGDRKQDIYNPATGAVQGQLLLGTAAAVRLLPRPSWAWRGAVLSLVAVTALLWLTGWHVLAGVGIAAAGLAYQAVAVRRRAALRARRPVVQQPCAVR